MCWSRMRSRRRHRRGNRVAIPCLCTRWVMVHSTRRGLGAWRGMCLIRLFAGAQAVPAQEQRRNNNNYRNNPQHHRSSRSAADLGRLNSHGKELAHDDGQNTATCTQVHQRSSPYSSDRFWGLIMSRAVALPLSWDVGTHYYTAIMSSEGRKPSTAAQLEAEYDLHVISF